ncbi:MAG: patatin family protein [Oscillospiraceae bacterium]
MKLGLVLEGGASRTLFSCGVLDFFLDKELIADYLIGTSAGIAYGVSYASAQRGRNLEITKKYMADARYMGVKHLLNRRNRSYYNMDFVYDEIPNELIPFDYEKFAAFRGDVVATVTNIATGEAEYIPVDRSDRKFIALRASCALPMLFPQIQIGESFYMDGGIADSIPFEQALRSGCDKVIVVLTREKGYVKHTEKTTLAAKLFYRKHPKFAQAIAARAEHYNNAVRRLRELEREGKAFVITPRTTLGTSRTESDPHKLTALYKIGYTQAKSCYRELTAFMNQTSPAAVR